MMSTKSPICYHCKNFLTWEEDGMAFEDCKVGALDPEGVGEGFPEECDEFDEALDIPVNHS